MSSSTELALVVAVAGLLGSASWMIDGRPPGIPDPAGTGVPLREGEVRLEQLSETQREGSLWVDARAPAIWRIDGLDGSINLSTQGGIPLDRQVAVHAEALLGAERIVVYCDDVFCGLSHQLVEALEADFSDLLGGEIVILHGGARALREEGLLGPEPE